MVTKHRADLPVLCGCFPLLVVFYTLDTQLKLNRRMNYSFYLFVVWELQKLLSHLFQGCNKMLMYIKIKFREKQGPISNVSFPMELSLVFPSRINTFGLPWWHSGWESSGQCRGHGFEPWSRKIPHAAEQLSPCATAAEAHAPRSRAQKQREATTISPRTTTKSGSRSPQLEKARAAVKTQCSHK